MKKLPIGIQTFKEIIKKNYLYVDKTKHIHNIITTGKTYFLSRPRRFGKSLLCSTLEEIFKGNKKLFKDLWIYDSDYEWESHPVIRIDMTKVAHDSPEELKIGLNEQLENIAEDNNISLESKQTMQGKFLKLVKTLSKKNKVVIIIDEYDKPILDHITNIEVADKMRDILRDFYTQFKSLDEYLSFIFITGVTKFAKTSIFSGLNNLKDLTFSRKGATLLGYTQEELVSFFEDRIQDLSSEQGENKDQIILKLKDWYNGYKFVEYAATVYNPFSILLVLDELRFKNYWFETGTPTFLVNIIREKNFDYTDPKSFEIGELQIGNFDIDNINPKTLLFQTGYLTINKYEPSLRRYYLKYPNREVEEALLEILLESFSGVDTVISGDTILELTDAFMKNNLNSVRNIIYNFFSSMPYTIQINHEKYYQSIFYTILRLLNIRINVEVVTNVGRIDAVISMNNYIYIFEFKINQSAQKALQQIEEKKYYEPYLEKKKKIIAIGINFDTKERNISGFEVKEID